MGHAWVMLGSPPPRALLLLPNLPSSGDRNKLPTTIGAATVWWRGCRLPQGANPLWNWRSESVTPLPSKHPQSFQAQGHGLVTNSPRVNAGYYHHWHDLGGKLYIVWHSLSLGHASCTLPTRTWVESLAPDFGHGEGRPLLRTQKKKKKRYIFKQLVSGLGSWLVHLRVQSWCFFNNQVGCFNKMTPHTAMTCCCHGHMVTIRPARDSLLAVQMLRAGFRISTG